MKWLIVFACFLSLASMTVDITLDRVLRDTTLGDTYDKAELTNYIFHHYFGGF